MTVKSAQYLATISEIPSILDDSAERGQGRSVPDKELDQLYLLDLGSHAYGHIRFWHLRNGKRILDYVIQIEVTAGGRTYTVRRYDCAHGQPHCDIYDHRGNQRKIWFPDTSKKDAWDAAVDEVLLHGSEWARQFLKLIGQDC